jgi:hypothetical protein
MDKEKEEDDLDTYKNLEELKDSDEITDSEEGFMMGYNEKDYEEDDQLSDDIDLEDDKVSE